MRCDWRGRTSEPRTSHTLSAVTRRPAAPQIDSSRSRELACDVLTAAAAALRAGPVRNHSQRDGCSPAPAASGEVLEYCACPAPAAAPLAGPHGPRGAAGVAVAFSLPAPA